MSKEPRATPEQKLVFAYSPSGQGDDVPVLLLGLSEPAWEYIKDGKTHHLDLTSLGIPIKLLMFGAKTRGDAIAVIEEYNRSQGVASLHLRDRDFGMKPK